MPELNPQQFWRAVPSGNNPIGDVVSHVGTRKAAEEAGTARAQFDQTEGFDLYEADVSAKNPFNDPQHPMTDDDVMVVDEHLRSGKWIHPYDRDYRETSGLDVPDDFAFSEEAGYPANPSVRNLPGSHDVVYYSNYVEDAGSVSAAVYDPNSVKFRRFD